MEEFQTHTLPNGLRLIYRPTQSAVSYCGFTVNAGTRDEDEGYSADWLILWNIRFLRGRLIGVLRIF